MAEAVLKAVKGNKAYTITEQEKNAYKAQGFDIYEGKKLVETGVGKSVSVEEFNKLKTENETLKKKISKLERELKDLKGSKEDPKETPEG
jgi:predicted  nucleic acid-binding Zn-ribbon protein